MFAGIGGFRYGIEKVIPQAECVGFSEIDKYAIQIYKKHYPETKNYGDATRIIPEELPDFDFLIGGFPCQSFSIAGKRGGFEDTRGTLFFEIARIARIKRPELLLLENVKGLLSHDKGRTFGTILSTLSELGYFLEWQVLNSKNFGVPQNRERVFVVGHFRERSRQKVFPIRQNGQKSNGTLGLQSPRQIAGSLRATDYKGTHNNIKEPSLIQTDNTKGNAQGARVYKPEGLSQTISSGGGGLGAKTGLYAVPLKFLDRNQKNYQGKYSFTVDSMNTGGILKNSRIRRLTPIECERLQGFPDGWTEGLSDTQRYKCLGNAVTTTVISEIIKKIF